VEFYLGGVVFCVEPMNSKAIYAKLCADNAHREEEWKPVGSLLERHRIVPGHQGGEYVPENCTYLTHRQHILAHYLLWRIHRNAGDRIAYRLMAGFSGVPAMLGAKHSAETRAKIGAAQKGRTLSAEARAKLSAANKGKKLSAEHRAKLSAAQKGKTLSAETRAKIGAVHKGKTLSAEHRAKMSAALKGKTVSAETRAKLAAANKGKKLSAEHRAKMSAAHKLRHARNRAAKALDAIDKPAQLVLLGYA